MADFKTMYYELFNAMTDAITRMQEAQRVAEEMYIEYEQSESIIPVKRIDNSENNEQSSFG